MYSRTVLFIGDFVLTCTSIKQSVVNDNSAHVSNHIYFLLQYLVQNNVLIYLLIGTVC